MATEIKVRRLAHAGHLRPEQFARMREANVDVIHATRAVIGGAIAPLRADRQSGLIAAIDTELSGNAFYAAKAEVVILTRRFCPGAGPARHHRERRGARLRPH